MISKLTVDTWSSAVRVRFSTSENVMLSTFYAMKHIMQIYTSMCHLLTRVTVSEKQRSTRLFLHSLAYF